MRVLHNNGFSIVETLLVLVVVGILGFTGWYVYHSKQVSDKTLSSDTSVTPKYKKKPIAAHNPASPPWSTYTSTFEKLSFKYPANWTSITPVQPSTNPSDDSFEVKSPSGAVTVSWVSDVDGIGGACDNTVMPGGTATNGPGPCPYWTVLDKQQLTGNGVTGLYYVDGVMTKDGTNYAPWCALQDSNGTLQSESAIGYHLFKGKTSPDAGLMCGDAFLGAGATVGSKAQATTALSSAEYQTAKQILLSAYY